MMGWPSVVAALFLYVVAVVSRSPRLGLVAALISAPFCVYVSAYPRVLGVGVLALCSNSFGVVALFRRRIGWAALSWLPFTALAGFIASWVFL